MPLMLISSAKCMHMLARGGWIVCLLAICMGPIGCKKTPDAEGRELIASFSGKPLYRDEMDHFLPKGLSSEDSIRYAKGFVETWVKDQAIAERARSIITQLDRKISYQIQDHERKLISYEFSNYLINSQLDTLVRSAEISTYYQKHPEKFIAGTKYYAYFHVKTENTNPYREVSLMRSRDRDKIVELKEWGKENALSYQLDTIYVTETEISRILEGARVKLELLQLNKVFNYTQEVEDKKAYNFFKLLDVIEEGDQLPLVICGSLIKDILLNQRKNALIEETEAELVKKARSAGKVEVVE